MRRASKLSSLKISIVVALVLTTFQSFAPLSALASTPVLSNTMVRLNNMTEGPTNNTTTGTVCFQPKTAATETSLSVAFPTGFTVASAASWTTTSVVPTSPSTYWPTFPSTTLAAMPNALTPTVAGQTVTFTFASGAALSVSDTYCFDWTNAAALSNPNSAPTTFGTINTYTGSSVLQDTGNFALDVIPNDTIVVTATVPPIFTMTVPSNADTFTGNLTPNAGGIATSGVTPTIQTNAKGGWIMWAKDSNAGLHSSSTSTTIPSVTWASGNPISFTTGVADYALSVVGVAGSGPCTPVAETEYDTTAHAPANGGGGQISATYQQIGHCASESNGDGMIIKEEAMIAVTTPAATDYTDTITVVGAGLF
jgi:hypothetical protein